MATFAYKALDLAGAPTKGEMEAGDKQAVAAQLRSKGLIVVDIEEQTPANAGDILARFRRVKADELVIATRQLATMVNSGMSLLRALYVIEEQTENEKLKETFAAVRKDVEAGLSLSDSLARHPDVILVGEMRDLETIATALTAAETGHLVFATLHTQDCAQTVDRIVDVFPPAQQGQVRVQLSVALQGIVTQQLLPTADGQGRCVATEVLVPTPAVRNLIREGKTHQIYSALQTGGQFGMQTMDASLVDLVRHNKITRELAEARSSAPDELRRLMGTVRAA